MEASGQLHAPPASPPWGENQVHLVLRAGKTQSRSKCCGDEKNLLPLPGIESRFLGRPPNSPSLYRLRYHVSLVERTWSICCCRPCPLRDRRDISRLLGNEPAPIGRVSSAPHNRLSISSLNWTKACSPLPSLLQPSSWLQHAHNYQTSLIFTRTVTHIMH
jgi:hypothetical protein